MIVTNIAILKSLHLRLVAFGFEMKRNEVCGTQFQRLKEKELSCSIKLRLGSGMYGVPRVLWPALLLTSIREHGHGIGVFWYEQAY